MPALSDLLRAVVLFLAFVAGSARMTDNSLFTHITTGRLLVRGDIAKLWNGWPDPYLYTSGGRSWVVQSWLASLIYGLIDRVGGGGGLRIFFGLSLVAIVAIVWRLARSEALLVRFFICAVVVFVGNALWSQRPLLFGVAGMGLVLLALQGELNPRWLLPVMWVWVNTHGSFPFAIAIAGLALAGRRLDHEPIDREKAVLRNVALGSLLGAVLNPIGPKLVLFPLALLRKGDMLQRVVEWRSPDFAETWARGFLVVVVVAIVAMARRSCWRLTLPATAMIAASLVAARNVGMAVVVLVPAMGYGLTELGSRDLDRRSGSYRLGIMAFGAIGLLWAGLATLGDSFDERAYPSAAVTWMQQRDLTKPSVRVVHQDFVGNYLELRYAGRLPVFVDDRIEITSREIFEEEIRLYTGKPGWRNALEGADVIVWERKSPLEALLAESDDWVVRYTDDRWLVACRPSDTRCR